MKKVVIGMSGGVDSSVAAILLKEQGYDIIGLFMRNWDTSLNGDFLGNPNLNETICPQEQDYNDALAVCQKLDIPLHRIDFVKEYWDFVFTYFLDELKKGRTPNPDIMCNKYIKFDYFIREAKRLGADYIATGHYAKREDGYLKRAKDKNKDQTYFLSQLNASQLKDVIFPIGDLEKQDVRRIAEEYGLITAKKKDSTGICFIGERNFREFLKNYLPNQVGDIIDIDSKRILGQHIGLMYYTIGQRRGLDIGGFDNRMFVVGKNLEKNILYVALGDANPYLFSDSCTLTDVNFNCDMRPKECTAKFRYRSQDIAVTLEYLEKGIVQVSYKNGKGITPGQACVLYVGDICIGGGIIDTVYKNQEKLWYLL